MMKRTLKHGVLVVMMMLVLATVACGGGSNATSNSSGSDQAATSNGDNKDTGGEKEDSGKTYTLTLNTTWPPPKYDDEPKAFGVNKFAQLIEEKTNGRVKMKIYWSNQLVPQDQALDALASGTIDMEDAGPYWSDKVPTQDFLWLPNAFYGPDYVLHLLHDTEIGQIFERNLENYGVKVVGYWPSGVEGIISKDPVTTIEDMKGKKFRMGSGSWKSWYESMGTAPVNVAAAEQYEALLRGTMDGTIYPLYTLDTYKFHEVAKHITVPGFVDPIMIMNYMSLKTWNKLPEDIQQAILEAGKEVEKEAVAAEIKLDDNTLKLAEQNGVTIHRLTREEFDRFTQSAQIVWDEFAAKNADTKRMVEVLKQDQKEYLEKNPEAKEWEKRWLAQ
jgi:TRAP-type C4-dicarboxylate transport system substrate-binding protein